MAPLLPPRGRCHVFLAFSCWLPWPKETSKKHPKFKSGVRLSPSKSAVATWEENGEGGEGVLRERHRLQVRQAQADLVRHRRRQLRDLDGRGRPPHAEEGPDPRVVAEQLPGAGVAAEQGAPDEQDRHTGGRGAPAGEREGDAEGLLQGVEAVRDGADRRHG